MRLRSITVVAVVLGAALAARGQIEGKELPGRDASDLGFDPAKLSEVEAAIQRAIDAGEIPGAVVLIGRSLGGKGAIAHVAALGNRALVPAPESMTRDTIFDLASLTKPVATATVAMSLWERGVIDLDQPITGVLPEFANHGKEAIDAEMLLRHRAGLIPDNPLTDYADGPELAWQRLAEIGLEGEPGEAFRYSDVGFLVLGRLLERRTGQGLDALFREHVAGPLGLRSTGFVPLASGMPAERIAPTESVAGAMLRGIVHDPRARALGSVAGHAGLFGTADDLAIYAHALLSGEAPNFLAPPTIRAMIDASDTPSGQRRGLGWDVETSYSAPRGERFGSRSFGHTGFTGTSLWVDPDTGVFVVLLTSRLHPDGSRPAPVGLRRAVGTLVAEAIVGPPLPPPARGGEPAVRPVACGVDVLEQQDGFDLLEGMRVGLVTNHTGRTRDGRSTIDVLHAAEGVELVALFSPEHGIRGVLDTKVDDSRDEATGLPIYSLYGETRKPKPETLAGLDALVYDIQDIGCRFYTYISTLGLVMEAAAEAGVVVVVLDRPNPIGGVAVEGPVREAEFESFIAYHDLPVRHGMTVGELARMFNAERVIDCSLQVVPCEGWRRGDLFDRTGLLWVNPSPNMRSPTEAMIYPGVGLLEATNLATGRGTDTPFERVGAPWIDPVEWSEALNELGLAGVRFAPVRFTPSERQYAGEECCGVYIMVQDWSRFEPVGLGIGMATTLRAMYAEDWEPEGLLRFVCSRPVYDAILEGRSPGDVRRLWSEGLAAFRARREGFLIYE